MLLDQGKKRTGCSRLPSPQLEADSGLDCLRFIEVQTVYWTTVKQDNEGATGTDLELRDDEKESVEPK